MSNTNGFHPSSLSIPDNGINDIAKRVPSISDKNKRLKSKNVVSIAVNETRSMKGFNKKQKAIDVKKKRLEHSDSNNNNNNSTKKVKHYSHSSLEHIPSTSSNTNPTHIQQDLINHDCCDSCGECYGEMISCDTCPSTFHLLCANPPLSKEDIPKGSYFCEDCRTITKPQEDFITKDKQQKLILPFSFDPKKNLQLNGFKKNQQYCSTLGQIKLPTASDGQSLIQPSGEIKFRATSNNNNKSKQSSLSNLKRKRIDSSPPPPSLSSTSCPNTQLDALHHLFISCRSEEFHGPSLLSNNSNNHIQKYCFICRKSSIKQGPSIHCDYCPLIYHLDCLTPPMTSLSLVNEKWMCPNHITPILDRYLSKKTTFSTNNRVKIYHQNSQIEQNIIIQDFTHTKQTKLTNNHQLEHINISQIPKSIAELYSKANIEQEEISKIEINDNKKESEEDLFSNESSSTYDPSIWDILQAILNHIANDDTYEFSSIIENEYPTKSSSKTEPNTLDTIDTLLKALNEPNSTSEQCTINETNDLESHISTSLTNSSFSRLIDLSQFRLSHAALIHLHTQDVIYIRKHVIWFGSSPLNDICLDNFNHSHPCQYITERHACLYYDRKHNLFELLNYSEYGTIVNDLRYGLSTNDDDDDDRSNTKQKNENLQKCFCLTKTLSHSAWDGPALIEQGTVIKIGCHEFLFYRHIVR